MKISTETHNLPRDREQETADFSGDIYVLCIYSGATVEKGGK